MHLSRRQQQQQNGHDETDDNAAMNLRHENRFWSTQIWNYFDLLNRLQGCNYRYILRMDTNSFIYSPIRYNIFDHMSDNDYHYGFRLCSTSASPSQTQIIWNEFAKIDVLNTDFQDVPFYGDKCLLYNAFFVADLYFF